MESSSVDHAVSREVRRGPYDETLLTPATYVIGKINYTHRGGGGGGGATAERDTAAIGDVSKKLAPPEARLSFSSLPHPLSPSVPLSDADVWRQCGHVYVCVYISTSRTDAAKPRAGVATAPKSSTDSLMVISHLCNLHYPSSRAFSISDHPLPSRHPSPAFLLSSSPFEPPLVRESRSWGMCTS